MWGLKYKVESWGWRVEGRGFGSLECGESTCTQLSTHFVPSLRAGGERLKVAGLGVWGVGNRPAPSSRPTSSPHSPLHAPCETRYAARLSSTPELLRTCRMQSRKRDSLCVCVCVRERERERERNEREGGTHRHVYRAASAQRGNTWKTLVRKPKPETGSDCLIRAIFVGQVASLPPPRNPSVLQCAALLNSTPAPLHTCTHRPKYQLGRCRASMAHIRQLRPDCGLSSQVKLTKIFQVVPLRAPCGIRCAARLNSTPKLLRTCTHEEGLCVRERQTERKEGERPTDTLTG